MIAHSPHLPQEEKSQGKNKTKTKNLTQPFIP